MLTKHCIWTLKVRMFSKGADKKANKQTTTIYLSFSKGHWLACENTPWGALAGGQEKEGESLEFEFHLQFPCGSPLTELSDFRQLARSGNERECKQTLKKQVPRLMTSLLMSSLPISISHRLFQCRYSNSRDVVASSPSFSLESRYSCYHH